MKAQILYKGKVIGLLSEGETMTLHCGGEKLTGDITVRGVSDEYIPYAAPVITNTDELGQIVISESYVNGDRTTYYRVYKSDTEYTDFDREPGAYVTYADTDYDGYSVWVVAFDADGNQSPASNIVSPRECFVAGTPVRVAYDCDLCSDPIANHFNYKPIETIVVGDKVISYDFGTSKYIETEIVEVVTGYTDRLAMVVYGSDDSYVVMAESHPLYTREGLKSITNKDGLPTLEVGDELLGPRDFATIWSIETFDAAPTLVYSLVLANGGPYLIGYGNGAAAATHVGGSH